MSEVWVCKDDGTIQCENNIEVTLDEMKALLASLVGKKNILDQEKRYKPMPSLCGLPTGAMNAYKITSEGAYILFHGFRGPDGFEECAGSIKSSLRDANKEVNHMSQVLKSSRLTSAKRNPVLIRELIGRPLRAYIEGSALTRDYIEQRVNIETNKAGVILDIWFG